MGRRTRSYRVTLENLELCFPELSDSERIALARESVRHTAMAGFEMPAVWIKSDEWRRSKITSVVGADLMQRAKASQKGVIILVPHFGNWEFASIRAAYELKTTAVYRPPRMQAMDAVLHRVRVAPNSTLVPATTRGVASVLKALKRGEGTLILPDQEPAKEGGIHANFFGVPALTMTLVYRLIQRTQPQVVVCYALRTNAGFNLGFSEPDPDIYSEDLDTSIAALNRTVEAVAKLDLSQYQWEYKRFRRRPEGMKNPYQGTR